MSETAQEDIVEINTEPQVVAASEDDMEIEVVDDRPMEDRVPPRAEAEPAPSDDDTDDEAAESVSYTHLTLPTNC